MSALESTLLSVIAAVISALITVLVTDYLGLRRDRARLRMDLDWQLQQQRWKALYEALTSCPRFSTLPTELIQSVIELTVWSQTSVEPWLGKERVQHLVEKRLIIEAWVKQAIENAAADSTASIDVPTVEINEFRNLTISEVSEALARMRSRFSRLTEHSKL